MPEIVSLSFARPQGLEHLSTSEFVALIEERVRQVEETVLTDRRRTGARVLGRRGVLAQKVSDRPRSREPRRELNPRVAARSKWSRIEALLRNKAFQDAYAAARGSFIAGLRGVLFPPGTYWLRRFASAVCAAHP